jgi:hypothetical protein
MIVPFDRIDKSLLADQCFCSAGNILIGQLMAFAVVRPPSQSNILDAQCRDEVGIADKVGRGVRICQKWSLPITRSDS